MNSTFFKVIPLLFFLFYLVQGNSQTFSKQFQFGNLDNSSILEIEKDTAGNLFLAGSFRDTLLIGDTFYVNKNFSNRQVYLAKFNDQEKLTWVRFIKGGIQEGPSLYFKEYVGLVLMEKQVCIAGVFNKSIRLNGNSLTSKKHNSTVFLAKLSKSGSVNEFEKIGYSGSNRIFLTDMKTSAGDTLVLTGTLKVSSGSGKLVLGKDSFKTDSFSTLFLAKIGANNESRWLRKFKTNVIYAVDLIFDQSGNIGFCGFLQGKLDFGGVTIESNGNSGDMFIGKVSGNGKPLWAELEGGKTRIFYRGYDLALGKNQNLIMAGGYGVYGYTSQGNLLYRKRGSYKTITTDENGNFYAAGSFEKEQNLYSFRDTLTLNADSVKGKEIFIIKGDPLGDIQWGTNFGSNGDDFVHSLYSDTIFSFLGATFNGSYLKMPRLDTLQKENGKDFILKLGNVKCEKLNITPEIEYPKEACLERTIQLKGQSQTQKQVKPFWELEDTVIYRQDISYAFGDTGRQKIRFSVKTKSGCRFDTNANLKVNPAPLSKFSFNKKGNGKVVFYPTDSTYPFYKWWFGDQSNTSRKVTPEHQYSRTGQFEVRLKTRIDSCLDVRKQMININSVSGRNDVRYLSRLKIFPQPVRNKIRIKVRLKSRKNLRMRLLNSGGKIVRNLYKGWLKKGKHTLEFNDLSKIQSGLYFLQVKDKKSYTKPVIFK